jgi:hypothetical protein
MSKKTKRYLMLLVAVGLITVAAGGSGTFATFNAQVSNNNNVFTSGTLFLHNTVNGTTCGSESASNNVNLGTPYTADNGCTTLFSTTLPTAGALLNAALTSGTSYSSFTVTAIHGSAIQAGDEIVLTNGANSQRWYATAAVATGQTTIPVAAQNAAFTFPITSTTVTDDARFVPVQISNAGSLDASGISVTLGTGGCNNSAAVTTSNTLSGLHNVGVTNLTLGTPLANGVPSGTVITLTSPSETVTTTQAANPGASSLTVGATAQSHPAASSVSWSVGFTGGATNLCTALPITIVETLSGFRHDTGVAAVGCAYPAANVVANYGCNFGATYISSLTTTPSLTALTLGSGTNTNTLAQLDASKSRYFVIGIQSPGSLANGSQNRQAKFDLVWNIDQA